jgi:hypothetical protein
MQRSRSSLAILIKSYIKPHVKILENTNVDYQRVKLEKTFFGFKKDLFICVTYNPPISSKYTQERIIGYLCKDQEVLFLFGLFLCLCFVF